jgi:hypothetical protein
MFEVPSLNDLISLFQSCSCDLRQTLLMLQFLAQSSNIINTPCCSSNESNTIISKPKWQSSRMFDAMYYSHLNEQWNESSLKLFFDDLTIKYTSEYKQAHLLLVNHSKNDAKR